MVLAGASATTTVDKTASINAAIVCHLADLVLRAVRVLLTLHLGAT